MMSEVGAVIKIKGKGQWKKWLPEAIQKAAFSKGTLRQIAASMRTPGLGNGGKRGHNVIAKCQMMAAGVIVEGRKRGIQRLRARSVAERLLDFWITGHVFDETKLWYSVRGKGWRRFSTLAHYSQVTWKDAEGVHDEDIIRPPKAMRRYNASVQWKVLDTDGTAGICPREGERPLARFYGTCTACDSHPVNGLDLKHLRKILPDTHLVLPSPCIQHHTGRAASEIAEDLGIFTRVWCLSKTFAEGDFHQDLEAKVAAVLEDDEDGLEIVDPEDFVLDPGDVGREFTQDVLDRCYRHGLGPGEGELGDSVGAKKVKAEFCDFFPVGWNRRRPLHLCPAGCCGPTACHSREVSLQRGKTLINRVILKCITQPALNKWTKLDPAFCQATLVVVFFSLIKSALEAKVKMTYEDLTASGQVQDEDPTAEEDYKGRIMRFGKRSLAFVGDPRTRMLQLVWTSLGQAIMAIHYCLFKHVTWYSHGVEGERYTLFDFLPVAGASAATNPILKALRDLSSMLFDPNGAGRLLLGPLVSYFGAPVHWPEELLRIFQKENVRAFCKIWRSLYHHFRRQPWLVAEAFHPAARPDARQDVLGHFCNARDCCRDPWLGRPLHATTSGQVHELLEPRRFDFVQTMYLRCMVTSTFAERIFAPLTRWTSARQARVGLHTVASKLVTTLFEEAVQRWWQACASDGNASAASGKCRSMVAKTNAPHHKQCAWHAYVEAQTPPESLKGAAWGQRLAHFNSKRAEFDVLPLQDQTEWLNKAAASRAAARGRRAPLDRLLGLQAEGEQLGGPWGLGARLGSLQASWPLSRAAVSEALERSSLDHAAAAWAAATNRVFQEDEQFPDNVDLELACFEGECLYGLRPADEATFNSVATEIRLLLRHHDLPALCPLVLELRSGLEVLWIMIGDHQWSHKLRCEVLSLRNVAAAVGTDVTELAFEQNSDRDEVKFNWPFIESETQFLLRLVRGSSNPWQIYVLRTVSDQVSTMMVESRTRVPLADLYAKEAQRLELLGALRLLKKMTEVTG
jgi:hypothetical protein